LCIHVGIHLLLNILHHIHFALLHAKRIESVQPATLLVTQNPFAGCAWIFVRTPLFPCTGMVGVHGSRTLAAEPRVNWHNVVSRVWVRAVQHYPPIFVLQQVRRWWCIRPQFFFFACRMQIFEKNAFNMQKNCMLKHQSFSFRRKGT
jgi:hypothetical protein